MMMTESHAHSPLPRGIGADDAARLTAPFALLADPSRLRILYALLEGGPMCVSDIAAAARTGESATSHQLAKLRAAGVVRSERRGREMWYQLADAHIRVLLDVAAEHYLAQHPVTTDRPASPAQHPKGGVQ
jgi:DNA-binding transcriptional ArsR family regulator